MVRFDDSLPILANIIAKELGTAELASGVALRDSTGRLAFFTSAQPDATTIDRISGCLRSQLGSYARPDRVFAGAQDFGVKDLLEDSSALIIHAGTFTLRLIDRRLVGNDWLRAPAPAAAPPLRFVFASLKGGVGRSTALSVAAAHFASRGRRVLAIDLDMEAPGLGAILLDEGTTPQYGVIDALVENGLSEVDEQFYIDLVGPSSLADRQGRIDVMPAFGLRSMRHPGDILAKIARAYLDKIRPDGTVATLLDQISDLVNHVADPTRYDVILIDARAGLHETAASALLGLGAEALLFGLNDPQTFHGYSALLAHMARFIVPNQPRPTWLQRLTMVQGKASADAAERSIFVDRCRTLFSDAGLGGTLHDNKEPQLFFPAAPFDNVPWVEDDVDVEIPDEDALVSEPLAILDDTRFRQFEPMKRRDLIAQHIYESSYGAFLDELDRALSDTDPRYQNDK